MSVSHGTRSVDEIEKKYDYFDTFGLIKRDGEFTFTPDPVGIECVVLHYFPDTRVSLFVDNAIKAILYNKSYKHLPGWSKKLNKWIEPCIDYSPGH